jgi:D-glycero-D-manno-heptose 1,7-bisphosphate phosphatase
VALPGFASGVAANRDEVVGHRRAVFLDRDGVINQAIVRGGKPYSPQSVDALEILPRVAQALEDLRSAGYLNVIVTNQPDVGSGKLARSTVEAMHLHLRNKLPIDAVKVCYHTDADNCACRKPKPGMILDAASEYALDLGKSYLVGDRWRDVEAAQAAGCQALFIDYQYSEKKPDKPYVAVNSLAEAAQLILQSGS